jgi:hypothetical protein
MAASSRWGRARRAASAIGPGLVVALVIGWICATRGGEILAALVACPPWVIAGATSAHLLTLALRTEAWRTVLAAAGGGGLSSRTLHAANSGAFLAGTVQGHAAMPVRIGLLRRLGGRDCPGIAQIALADCPIVLLEVCTSALLAAIAATAVLAIPDWLPAAMLLAGLGALWGLRLVHRRFRHHPLAAGLAVLADARLRSRLAAVVLAFTAMAMLRTWIVLVGFGLPSAPADVALVLFSMGAIGLLPIGVGTGPAATVAALGTTNLAAAAAAGMVVSAATVLAVLVYVGVCWTLGVRFTDPAPAEPGEPATVIPFPLRHCLERPDEADLAA